MSQVRQPPVPYARYDVELSGKVCPVCGDVYREDADATGEATTTTYKDHYRQQHMVAEWPVREDGEH